MRKNKMNSSRGEDKIGILSEYGSTMEEDPSSLSVTSFSKESNDGLPKNIAVKIDPYESNIAESPEPSHAIGNSPNNVGVGNSSNGSEKEQLIESHGMRELSNIQAIFHLFKVFTGPSTLGIPKVMKNGGLLFGSVGFLVIAYLASYGNILVVNCGRLLCKRTGVNCIRYEEVIEQTIISYSGTKKARTVALIVRRMVVAMLCLCQFGTLAFYIQIIGTTLQYEVDRVGINYNLPMTVTKLFICLSLIPYSWMKNLKVLSWFSLLANICVLIGSAIIFQYSVRHLKPISEVPWVTNDPWTIPLFLSASVFCVEGVPMLLPIENRVKNPEEFGGLCGIITLSATLNITVNLCIGFYGYLALGDDVPDNILTVLPGY